MRTTMRRSSSIALLSLASAGLIACAASPDRQAPTSDLVQASQPPSSSVTVGGMTNCTQENLGKAATGAAQALGADNLYTIDDLLCADGWAVTTGILANRNDPDFGAPTSFIFEQEGQFWVLQDKGKVCGTMPTTTTAPVDATIPASLFISGCAAG